MTTSQTVIDEEYLPADTITLKSARLYVANIQDKDKAITAYMMQLTDMTDKVHTIALSRNQLIKINSHINQLIVDTVESSSE